jgi:hypothetical protein
MTMREAKRAIDLFTASSSAEAGMGNRNVLHSASAQGIKGAAQHRSMHRLACRFQCLHRPPALYLKTSLLPARHPLSYPAFPSPNTHPLPLPHPDVGSITNTFGVGLKAAAAYIGSATIVLCNLDGIEADSTVLMLPNDNLLVNDPDCRMNCPM